MKKLYIVEGYVHAISIFLAFLFLLFVFIYITDGREKEQARFNQCIAASGQWVRSPNGYVCVVK